MTFLFIVFDSAGCLLLHGPLIKSNSGTLPLEVNGFIFPLRSYLSDQTDDAWISLMTYKFSNEKSKFQKTYGIFGLDKQKRVLSYELNFLN